MEPNATRFPFPLPPRTIGEQKAKVKAVLTLLFSPRQTVVYYLRKKVVAIAAVVFTRAQTAALETGAPNRMGTSRSARVFPRAPSPRGPCGARASLWFRTDSPSAAYCCARKQISSLKCSSRMACLLSAKQIEWLHPSASKGCSCAVHSRTLMEPAAAGMISASSPSICRNSLAVTKPIVLPGFLVIRTQAIFSISRLLGIRLSS